MALARHPGDVGRSSRGLSGNMVSGLDSVEDLCFCRVRSARVPILAAPGEGGTRWVRHALHLDPLPGRAQHSQDPGAVCFVSQLPVGARHRSCAGSMKPESGIAHHRLGIVFENLGRLEDAKASYRRASELGYKGAEQEISRLESPGRGLLPPGRRTPTPRTTRGAPEMSSP